MLNSLPSPTLHTNMCFDNAYIEIESAHCILMERAIFQHNSILYRLLFTVIVVSRLVSFSRVPYAVENALQLCRVGCSLLLNNASTAYVVTDEPVQIFPILNTIAL